MERDPRGAVACVLLATALGANLGGCGSDEEVDTCEGEDACAALRGNTFVSVELLNCGITEQCHWKVSFDTSGGYDWVHTDYGEQGTYSCTCAAVHGQGNMGTREGEYDAQSGVLTWEDLNYELE